MSFKAAVLGASGYAGGELVKLLDAHEAMGVVHLGSHSRAGGRLRDAHPHLDGGDRRLGPIDADSVPEADVVFLALPHGVSAGTARALAGRGMAVVDLGSDFRLDTDTRYREAYGDPHPYPDELGDWVYGLPELFDLAGSRTIASPGCYPTAVLLALAPVIEAGLTRGEGIVANCLSGTSGAGREARADLTFGAVDQGVRAYAVAGHRHRPEMEMALDTRFGDGHRLTFTPHLVPMQRGILATVTVPADTTTEVARACLRDFYAHAPFVDVVDVPPQTRWVVGSNRALTTADFDHHTSTLILQCAIDNLGKGAAGQALQTANIVLGLDETAGLSRAGWMP